jgi:hypothetical protein
MTRAATGLLACMFVRALVSGLPRPIRLRRYVLVLQVCIDDSRTEPDQGPTFLLAGFMTRVRTWERFSDEWRAYCNEKPRVAFVKGKHAFERSGPFKGWTVDQRDRKLLGFASIIEKFKLKGVVCLINHNHFKTHPGRIRFGEDALFRTPEYTAVSAVTCAVLGSILRSPTEEKVSFVYDERVVTRRELADGYQSICKALPQRAVKLIAHEPQFQNDKEFMPLQAADLFAYYVGRETYERSRKRQLESAIWTRLSKTVCINASVNEGDLEAITRNSVNRVNSFLGMPLVRLAPLK